MVLLWVSVPNEVPQPAGDGNTPPPTTTMGADVCLLFYFPGPVEADWGNPDEPAGVCLSAAAGALPPLVKL